MMRKLYFLIKWSLVTNSIHCGLDIWNLSCLKAVLDWAWGLIHSKVARLAQTRQEADQCSHERSKSTHTNPTTIDHPYHCIYKSPLLIKYLLQTHTSFLLIHLPHWLGHWSVIAGTIRVECNALPTHTNCSSLHLPDGQVMIKGYPSDVYIV